MKIEGGCVCGKVRYSADAEPIFVGVCHCSNCQKASGSRLQHRGRAAETGGQHSG